MRAPQDSLCTPPRQRRWPPLGSLIGLVLLGLLSSCTSVKSSHWNLYQLHEFDGTPRRVGDLRNGIEQNIREFIDQTEFKVPFNLHELDTSKVIKDPLRRCLHNLNGLLAPDNPSDVLRARQVNIITWLSDGCTNPLSRERCALALGPLARHFGVLEPGSLDTQRAFATPEEVGDLIAGLVRAVTPERLEEPPKTRGTTDPAAWARAWSERVLKRNYDRNGLRRMLTGVSAVLEGTRSSHPARPALERLRSALAAQCLGLALRSAVDDESPLVRAAGLAAWIEATSGEDARPYALAMGSGVTENIQVAARGMARHGIPPIPQSTPASTSSEDPQAAERYWAKVMTQLLDSLREGPATVSLCHAMSQLTGLPSNLRPEYWIAWQLDQEALLQDASVSP